MVSPVFLCVGPPQATARHRPPQVTPAAIDQRASRMSSLLLDNPCIDALPLHVRSLLSLSEVSQTCLQLFSQASRWTTALVELKHQHGRTDTIEFSSADPRRRLVTALRSARRDVEHVQSFFRWECDVRATFDMCPGDREYDHLENDFGLTAQTEIIIGLREKNRPRYNLLTDIIILDMAMEELQGALSYYNTYHKKVVVRLKDPVNDVYNFGPLMRAHPPACGRIHPCSGSSFGAWWAEYVFDAFGAGEGACPDSKLLEIRFGSDAHLQHLLRTRPPFLSLGLWGTDDVKLLDLLGDVRDQLSDLCARFPFKPELPPRFLVSFMETYAHSDAFFAAHPQHNPETYFQGTDGEDDVETDESEEDDEAS